jgi:hypothetical protein
VRTALSEGVFGWGDPIPISPSPLTACSKETNDYPVYEDLSPVVMSSSPLSPPTPSSGSKRPPIVPPLHPPLPPSSR